jgi:hypothetical protein
MAGENATDDDFNPAPLDDSAIDDAVGDLRGVLKKDAGEEPVLNDESVDDMGGAASFGSDFGADFEDDSAADAAADDPFNIGDTPEAGGTRTGWRRSEHGALPIWGQQISAACRFWWTGRRLWRWLSLDRISAQRRRARRSRSSARAERPTTC